MQVTRVGHVLKDVLVEMSFVATSVEVIIPMMLLCSG
jgi:hypothetical protein